jgi:hypothetical protein
VHGLGLPRTGRRLPRGGLSVGVRPNCLRVTCTNLGAGRALTLPGSVAVAAFSYANNGTSSLEVWRARNGVE